MTDVIDAELETLGSDSLPRRIYAYTLPERAEREWSRSRGQELLRGRGLIKVGETTRSRVSSRLKEQLGTAYPNLEGVEVLLDETAVRKDGTGFRDHDVHRALQAQGVRRAGGEWFECTLDEVKAAVASLRNGTTFESTRTQDFGMRPEQENAVAMTAGYFRSHKDGERAPHFLWNAKMRFGKTFTTYQLAREMDWTRVLVLTYKPAVQSAWKEDLLGHVDFERWRFVDRETPLGDLDSAADGSEPLVWFASFQDLGGKNDGRVKKHNENLYLIDWDCIVVDEYHFGAWRSSARDLYDKADAQLAEIEEPEEEVTEEDLNLKAKHYLYLSGTPFRAITNGEFTEDQVFNWTYIDEQREKATWDAAKDENPYLDLPAIEMYTYRMGREADATADDGEFNGFSLNEYFRAKKVPGGGRDEYDFADETGVAEFLEMLRGKLSSQMKTQVLTGQKPPFPYEDVKFARAVRHSVWYLNDVGACYAMKAALEKHVYFRDFIVHVAAGTRAGQGSAAKPPVEEAIRMAESEHRSGTIILSCGKLMTGVTIKEWSAIFMLRSLKSPESYFQAAFRVQSPWAIRNSHEPKEILKKTSYIFEFDPNRALTLVAEYGTKLATSTNSTSQEVLGELINYLPIFAFDGSQMTKLDANAVLDWAASGIGATALAARWNSPLLVDVTEATLTRLLANPELLDSLEQIEDFRNLRTDVGKVITTTKNLKGAKREQGGRLDGDQKKEQRESASLRKQIREKLQKFVARVPVFMYLTDFREEALKHVIESLDPALFERVTGLTIGDFRQLSAIGVFNAQNMDFAIYQFRQFENASLRYASTAGEGTAPTRVGLWERSVDTDELPHET